MASPPASVEEIAIAVARLETVRSAAWVAGNHSDDGLSMSSEDAANLAVYLDALLSDRAAMAERVAGLEWSVEEKAQEIGFEWPAKPEASDQIYRLTYLLECLHSEAVYAKRDLAASEAEVARLRDHLAAISGRQRHEPTGPLTN